MSDGATAVSGMGLQSSIGGVVTAAAAFRCGMSRAEELPEWPYFDEVEQDDHILVGHPATGVAPGFQGIARLLKLGTNALKDLGASVDLASLDLARTGVFLVLPPNCAEVERRPGELLQRLCTIARLRADAQSQRTSFEGRVGIANAIRDAQTQLENGRLDHVVVGAIDTFLTAERISTLIESGEIKTEDNPVGLVPGEAAAFILLEQMEGTRRRSGRTVAFIQTPVSAATSAAPPPPNDAPKNAAARDERADSPGKALGEVLLAALRAHGSPPLEGTLYADLNGTTPRAFELATALVQVSSALPFDGWRQAFPAVSFGETGAASGLVAACMAVRAFARGYARGNHALVAMSGSTGGKAAFLLGRSDPS